MRRTKFPDREGARSRPRTDTAESWKDCVMEVSDAVTGALNDVHRRHGTFGPDLMAAALYCIWSIYDDTNEHRIMELLEPALIYSRRLAEGYLPYDVEDMLAEDIADWRERTAQRRRQHMASVE